MAAQYLAAYILLLLCFPLTTTSKCIVDAGCLAMNGSGSWEVLSENAGIASMHTAVTHTGSVVLLDRTHIGRSQLPLPGCRKTNHRAADCTAHSALFNPGPNTIHPLSITSDTWCSSGQFMPDGTLLQTGGNGDGFSKIRAFTPCDVSSSRCEWVELPNTTLQDGRWYSTNQLLPDGSQFVVGGRGVFTYELVRLPMFVGAAAYSPPSPPKTLLPFLKLSQDAQSDILYPYVHLLPDGNLFIFANRYSIVYDYHSGSVVRTLPEMPGNPRNYPSAGSSVLLPLRGDDVEASTKEAEVLVCGGAPLWCNEWAVGRESSRTCGRLRVGGNVGDGDGAEPAWEMEEMPFPRAMGDMLFLPTSDVLIINGAQKGCQGWDRAAEPAFFPLVYRWNEAAGRRFTVQTPSRIARLYHSTANLLPDARVLVAGSNPHERYNFTAEFPTELRLEAFSPEYLGPAYAARRPTVLPSEGGQLTLSYDKRFQVLVAICRSGATLSLPVNLELTLLSSPFTTHSFSQGLRLLRLPVLSALPVSDSGGGRCIFIVNSLAPISPSLAPPSYYMLFAVNDGIPSNATWVRLVMI